MSLIVKEKALCVWEFAKLLLWLQRDMNLMCDFLRCTFFAYVRASSKRRSICCESLNGVWNGLCASGARPGYSISAHRMLSFCVNVINTGVPPCGGNMYNSQVLTVQFLLNSERCVFLASYWSLILWGRELTWFLGAISFYLCDYSIDLLRVNWRYLLRKPLKQ